MSNFKDDNLEILYIQKAEYFLLCSGLEKKLSDTNTEKETLKTKIIQVELKQEDDRKTRNEEEKRRKDETYNSARSTEVESTEIGRLMNHQVMLW